MISTKSSLSAIMIHVNIFFLIESLDASGVQSSSKKQCINRKNDKHTSQTEHTHPPVIGEPVINEPVIKKPIVDQPVIDEPVTEQPVNDEPVIEEDFLETLSQQVAPYWKQLGRKLKVSSVTIDTIQRDHVNYDGLTEKAFAMLRHWKEREEKPSLQQIDSALRALHKVDTAQKFCLS